MASNHTSEEQAVLDVLLAFSDGIKAKSTSALLSLILPTGTTTRTGPTDNSKPIQCSLTQLVEYIAAAFTAADIEGVPIVENATVVVDKNLAWTWVKWESYKTTAEGAREITHVGNMIWIFCKVDGQWKICGSADNQRLVAEAQKHLDWNS